MYWMQAGTWFFLVYSVSFLILGYFCDMGNVCSKQAGTCFLVYETTFLMQKMCVQNNQGASF